MPLDCLLAEQPLHTRIASPQLKGSKSPSDRKKFDLAKTPTLRPPDASESKLLKRASASACADHTIPLQCDQLMEKQTPVDCTVDSNELLR